MSSDGEQGTEAVKRGTPRKPVTDGELEVTFYLIHLQMPPGTAADYATNEFQKVQKVFDMPHEGWDKTREPLPLSVMTRFITENWPGVNILIADTRSTRFSRSMEGRVAFDYPEFDFRLKARWAYQPDGGFLAETLNQVRANSGASRSFGSRLPQPGFVELSTGREERSGEEPVYHLDIMAYTEPNPDWSTIQDMRLYSLTGQVLLPGQNPTTGAPLPAVGVQIKAVADFTWKMEAMTDSQGAFRLRSLEHLSEGIPPAATRSC